MERILPGWVGLESAVGILAGMEGGALPPSPSPLSIPTCLNFPSMSVIMIERRLIRFFGREKETRRFLSIYQELKNGQNISFPVLVSGSPLQRRGQRRNCGLTPSTVYLRRGQRTNLVFWSDQDYGPPSPTEASEGESYEEETDSAAADDDEDGAGERVGGGGGGDQDGEGSHENIDSFLQVKTAKNNNSRHHVCYL